MTLWNINTSTMDTDLEYMISMGFNKEQSTRALEVTGNKGVQPAVEWLLSGEANIPVVAPPSSLSVSSFFPVSTGSGNLDFLSEGEEEETPLSKTNLLYVRLKEDISYFEAHEKNKLNIFIPEPPGNDVPVHGRPVILHVHGGGWLRGDRNTQFYGGPFMGRAFAQRGMVAVVISYRVRVPFPLPIMDVINAVKWVLASIDQYGGDPQKLFLSGHSAGGHLVSLLASHPEYFSSFPPNTIKGVMSISGIYNLEGPLSSNPKDCKNILFRSYYVNGTFGNDSAVWQQASPLFHLDQVQPFPPIPGGVTGGEVIPSKHPGYPPFCVFNASLDFGLEYDGQRFFESLVKKGVVAQYHLVVNTSHASITKSEEVANRCVEFINCVLDKGKN